MHAAFLVTALSPVARVDQSPALAPLNAVVVSYQRRSAGVPLVQVAVLFVHIRSVYSAREACSSMRAVAREAPAAPVLEPRDLLEALAALSAAWLAPVANDSVHRPSARPLAEFLDLLNFYGVGAML